MLQPPHELEQVQEITFHLTKGWAYTRAESSPNRHAKTRHRLFRLHILAQRGNAYTPAESSRGEYSRVQSSPIRLAKTRQRLFRLRNTAAREYAPTQSSQVESSPVQSDSPRSGICLTYNGCARECVYIGTGKSSPTSLAELTVLVLHVSVSSVGLQGSGVTAAILRSEMDVEK